MCGRLKRFEVRACAGSACRSRFVTFLRDWRFRLTNRTDRASLAIVAAWLASGQSLRSGWSGGYPAAVLGGWVLENIIENRNRPPVCLRSFLLAACAGAIFASPSRLTAGEPNVRSSETVIVGSHGPIPASCRIEMTNIAICQRIVDNDKRVLADLAVRRRAGKMPLAAFEDRRQKGEIKLKGDLAVLTKLQAGGFPQGKVPSPGKQQGFLFPQRIREDLDESGEMIVDTDNWAGPIATTFEQSNGIAGIYNVTGRITVPSTAVPPGGQCDGVHATSYVTLWWLGIGGTDDNDNQNIFQAGVQATTTCSVGSTSPNLPTYAGWEENTTTQNAVVLIPALNGTIKEGDVIEVQVSSNFNNYPDGSGVMTWFLNDRSQPRIGAQTGTVSSGASYVAPYSTGEAITERALSGGGFLPLHQPTTSTTPIFTDLMISVGYGYYDYGTLTNVTEPLNEPAGGTPCGGQPQLCVSVLLNTIDADQCESAAATGSEDNPDRAGYNYSFISFPPNGLSCGN